VKTTMRQLALGLAVAAAAVVVPAGAAGAAGPAPSAAGGDAGQVCGVLLDDLAPGQDESDVLREGCADTQAELEQDVLRTAANTHLMTVYEHADYGGAARVWYGAYGPCDSEGYGIKDLSTYPWPGQVNMNDKISSWRIGASSCSAVYMYENAYYGGRSGYWHWWNQVGYVGDALNDRISSIFIHYQP